MEKNYNTINFHINFNRTKKKRKIKCKNNDIKIVQKRSDILKDTI